MSHRFWTAWSFLILGLLTAGLGAVMLTIRLRALKGWTHVEGHVTESAVRGPDMDDSFSATVTVRWQINGSDFSKEFSNWGGRPGAPGSTRSSRATRRAPPRRFCATRRILPAHFWTPGTNSAF
jgi:hypothetical protein